MKVEAAPKIAEWLATEARGFDWDEGNVAKHCDPLKKFA